MNNTDWIYCCCGEYGMGDEEAKIKVSINKFDPSFVFVEALSHGRSGAYLRLKPKDARLLARQLREAAKG